MWWIDRSGARALLPLVALGAAAALAACSTTPIAPVTSASPLTPTEQYTIQVEQVPDQLALTPHAEGLSERQQAAIAAFVQRWRETGRADIAVRTPAGGDVAAGERTTAGLLDMLRANGVPAEQVRVGPYDTAGAPGAPVIASFMRYEARGPNCEEGWDNLVSTGENRPSTHFGCAVTANLAAMIADPRDLVSPAPTDPPDAARRATVLQRYQAGQVTSSAVDEQSVGTISNAVN